MQTYTQHWYAIESIDNAHENCSIIQALLDILSTKMGMN